MELKEAKQQFVQLWGTLGSNWGINRTMAQVHALLMVSPQPLSTEDVMDQLSISRGNANMNLRELINWNLIYKELKMGERREFFKAEKDIWEIAKRVASERRRREIVPVRTHLIDLADIKDKKKSEEAKEFVRMVDSIENFVGKMDNTIETVLKADENWFFSRLIKVLK